MKAIVQTSYGSPDCLELEEMPKSAVDDGQVLVPVQAASPNAGDF